MTIPKSSRAAVMVSPRKPFQLREYPLPQPDAGEALVKVRCCTICRSDLHTWAGRRPGPTPAILGHEIVGEIAALAPDMSCDAAQHPLSIGDRVTWTIHSSCGTCFYCHDKKLPMKCVALRKYGHQSCEQSPHLNGGFAEYCLISRGTELLRIPDALSDLVAAPANCAAATAVASCEAAELKSGDQVLIQGAGTLGCYAAAYASFLGCQRIIVTDVDDSKLEFVRQFGATDCFNTKGFSPHELPLAVKELTGRFGCDSALEMAGVPEIVNEGLHSLRTGGIYVEVGSVFPEAECRLDLSMLVSQRLTLRGLHNYHLCHLKTALEFLSKTVAQYPYDLIVSRQFSLENVNEAILAAKAPSERRVALIPQVRRRTFAFVISR